MEYVILYAVDGVLLLLLLCTILRCAHLGLVRSLAGIVAWVAAAAIALHFCAPLAETCYDRFLHERVLALAEENIQSAADATLSAAYTNDVLKGLPDFAVKAAEGVGVDVGTLQEKAAHLPQNTAAALEKNCLAPICKAALKAVLFLAILLVISGLAVFLLNPVGKALHKLPLIGTTDRALGAVFGLLKGAVLVAVLAMLLRVAGEIAQGEFGSAVENSRVVSFVANSPFSDGLFR